MSQFAVSAWAADTQFSASYSADNAGDGRFSAAANERWAASSTAYPHWLRADLGTAQVATWYRVDPGRSGSDPSAWTFQGSNDASSWTTIDTQTGQTFTNQTRTYSVTNTTAYRYYRLNITAGAANAVSVAEFEIGDGRTPGTVWEHIPPGLISSGNFTTGLVVVVNSAIDVTHLLAYVGTTSGTWELRLRDSAGTVIASASYVFNTGSDTPGWRELPITPVTLAPGTYMVEQYGGGARYVTLSGNHPAAINYGPGGEVTVPQQATVTFRGSNNTSRQSAGNTEPTSALGIQAIHGIRFVPAAPSGLDIADTASTATALATTESVSIPLSVVDGAATATAVATVESVAIGFELQDAAATATAGAALEALAIPVQITDAAAAAIAAATVESVSVDGLLSIADQPATATAVATLEDNDLLEGWDVELTGRALVGIGTTTTDLYVPPAPADPPPGVQLVTLQRNSHQMPALSAVKQSYRDDEYPVIAAPAGEPRVWVDGVDRTFTADGELIDIDGLVSEKGFGDRTATANVNSMQIWDRPGFGMWDWIDVAHQVEVGLIRPDGTRHVWWAGDLISDEADSTSGPGSSTFEASWLAQGPMVQLAQAKHQPLDRMDPTDIGIVAARVINAVISKRYPPVKPVITGILTTKLGTIRQSVAEYVRTLFATAWVGNQQWGLVRSEDNPRQYEIALTDTTTVHWTVTAGAPGVSARLSEDWSQVTNVIYGSGSLANGHRWMNRRYPYLLPYKPPTYFSGDTSAELLLGSTDADTINNGVSLYTRRLQELGYDVPLSSVMLAVHVSATRHLQARRGLTVDGRVGGQTWTSVWSIGATGADLRSVRLPLAADPRVEPWLYLPNGDIAEPNPAYVPGHPRLEDDLDYGENTTLAHGIEDAQQRVDRLKDPATLGTLTLGSCPWNGSRWEIQNGQNILLKGWRGRDVLLHVADVRINRKAGTVTLTVDSAFRDALTVHEVRKRNAESKADPARKPGALGRTRSGSAPDMTTPFDGDSAAGIVPELTIRGGKWSVWPVAVDKVGTLAKIWAKTYDPATRYGILLWGREVMPNQLNAGVGNILTQSRPWSSPAVQAFLDRFGFIDGWGQEGQACGYGYGSEQDGDPINGEFYATPGVNYISEVSPFVWFSVLAEHDCRITAELDPKAWL